MTDANENKTVTKTRKVLLELGYLVSDTEYGFKFDMVDGLSTELVFGQCDKRHIEFSLLISFLVDTHKDLDTFTLSLSPHLIPIKISALEESVNLQLDVKATHQSIKELTTESLLLMRHVSGAVFTEALLLTAQKKDLFVSFESALKNLRKTGVAC